MGIYSALPNQAELRQSSSRAAKVNPAQLCMARGGGTGGALGARAPPCSPQSMKCPTSTGVHVRPTMYQEGVPRGAINFCLYVKCPLTPVPPPPPLQNMFRRLCAWPMYALTLGDKIKTIKQTPYPMETFKCMQFVTECLCRRRRRPVHVLRPDSRPRGSIAPKRVRLLNTPIIHTYATMPNIPDATENDDQDTGKYNNADFRNSPI